MKGLSIALILVALPLSPLLGCRKAARAGGNDKAVDTGRWIEQLTDPAAGKRQEAAFSLANSAAAAKAALGPLTKALRDSDGEVRAQAAVALSKVGPDAGAAVPALIEMMKNDSSVTARSYATWALGEIGPGAKSAVPSLMEALSDKVVAESAAAALETLGEGPAAAKRLTDIVHDAKAAPETRASAVMGLKKAGDRKAAVALMISIIEDKKALPEIRRAAALGVGHMGYDRVEEAKSAVPALLANLDHPDVCHSGPWSLWALGATEQAVARLTGLLAHRNPQLKAQAASGLVHMAGGNPPPEAKTAVPALIEALKARDDARTAVISALGEIGPDAKEAVPALMALLKDDDEWTRDRANDAIKKIAPNP